MSEPLTPPGQTEALWKLALEAVGDSVWDWHIQSGVEHFSAGFLRLYGYADGELAATPEAIDALTHPEDRAQMQLDREAHFNGSAPVYRNEHRVRCKDGRWKWILTRGLVIARDANGRPARMVGTHTDITERKTSETALWQAANFDPLTGLSNRRRFAERLEHELRRSRRDGQRLALLAVDLDDFKPVNDRLGHAAGDTLLAEVAQRLQAGVRELDMVARLGGDEFAVLLCNVENDSTAVERVARDLLLRLAEPYALREGRVQVTASIGIALCPRDGREADTLLACADRALYAAKAEAMQHGAFRFHTVQLQRAAQARGQLADELQRALRHNEFRLRFQPVLTAQERRCVQAEALLRWHHPLLGELPPRSFLPTAEAAGLMEAIGDWVLREAAAQARAWRAASAPHLMLSVNLDGSQLRHGGRSVPDWTARLQRLGVPGSGLVLDVPEDLLRDSQAKALLHLPALQAAGIRVVLDDFGNGLGALSALAHRGLTGVKLSRDRVATLGTPQGAEWLRCVTKLARAHGLTVVAKGVEHEVAARKLTDLGVDALLGSGLAPALPAPEFEAWLAS